MPVHTLYAYVDGSDLLEVAGVIEAAFDAFVSTRSWSRKTWVVNQQHPRDEYDGPGDIPAWDLGLNHELPDPGAETAGWFEDVEEIVQFLGSLATTLGREFVLGVASGDSGVADDLYYVASSDVDLPTIRAIVGLRSPPTRLTDEG